MNITQVAGTERLAAGAPSDSNLYKLSAMYVRRGVPCKLSARAAAEAVGENSPGEESCGHWQNKLRRIRKIRRIHSPSHSPQPG